MTTTIEKPETAQARLCQAAEHVKTLESELAQLHTRQQAAAAAVETFNGTIAREERSGDQEVLAELRSERRAAAESLQDLARSIGTIEQELTTAKGTVHVCTRAVQAERYNSIVEQNRELTDAIEQAVRVIVAASSAKQRLAVEQARMHGTAYPNLNPVELSHLIAGEISKRLTAPTEGKTSIRCLDWTCRRMTPGGDLEAPPVV